MRSGSFLVGLMIGAAIASLGAYFIQGPAIPPPATSMKQARPAPPAQPKPPPPRLRSEAKIPLVEMLQVGPMILSPGGRWAAVGGTGGKVMLYDLLMDRALAVKPVHIGAVRALVFSARAKSLIVGLDDGRILVFSVPTLKRRMWLRSAGTPVRSMARAGTLLAVAAEQPDLELLPLGSGKGRLIKGHTGGLRAVAATPDGKLLASGGQDGEVRLWRLPGGEPSRTLEGHKLWINTLAFSKDGSLLASAGFDKSALLWNVATGEKVHTLRGHIRAITGLDFAPNGLSLATSSLDRTVRIWSLEDGRARAEIKGHHYQVNSVIWGPHSRRLVSASGDGTLRITPYPTLLPQNQQPVGLPGPGALILRRNTSGERAVVQLLDEQGAPTGKGLKALGLVMRSGPDDLVHSPDPQLARLLYKVADKYGRQREITVVSGYRSPAYNKLRSSQSKQVGKLSAHMEGKAIDIRIEGVPITTLRTYLKKLKAGGVGFYADSRFVHMDIRPYRYWEGD